MKRQMWLNSLVALISIPLVIIALEYKKEWASFVVLMQLVSIIAFILNNIFDKWLITSIAFGIAYTVLMIVPKGDVGFALVIGYCISWFWYEIGVIKSNGRS